MENIYQEALLAVRDGAGFKVDYRHRSLKIDEEYIIRDGKFEGGLGIKPCSVEEFLANMEELYRRYKHSVPSERSESKSRQYFRALPEKDLDDDDMLYGEPRDVAQIALELYLLGNIILGLGWNAETMGNWFWQSKKDKDLVILREWVEPQDNKQQIKIV